MQAYKNIVMLYNKLEYIFNLWYIISPVQLKKKVEVMVCCKSLPRQIMFPFPQISVFVLTNFNFDFNYTYW